MTDRNDYATQLASFLEELAAKIRRMTVDRVADAVTWTALGLVVATLAFLIVLWVIVGLFRALGALIGMEVAYAVVGGIFVVAGAFIWSKRFPADNQE